MNKAINLAGLPNAFIQLLLHQLNSAAIHLPAWAPGRHFLERGGEGALFLCTAVEHPKPISFQLQSCFLSFFLRQGARLRLFWTTVSCPLEAQVTNFKTEILDAQVFLLMKTYIANFFVWGDATRSHLPLFVQWEPLLPPVLQEDHTALVVWGHATTCHEAGPSARQGQLPREALGWPQPLESLWQQCQGEPDSYEAVKDRIW